MPHCGLPEHAMKILVFRGAEVRVDCNRIVRVFSTTIGSADAGIPEGNVASCEGRRAPTAGISSCVKKSGYCSRGAYSRRRKEDLRPEQPWTSNRGRPPTDAGTALSKEFRPVRLITHRFLPDGRRGACGSSGRAGETHPLKVVIGARALRSASHASMISQPAPVDVPAIPR